MNSQFVQSSFLYLLTFGAGFLLAFYIMGGEPEVNIAEYNAKIEVLQNKVELQNSKIVELDNSIILSDKVILQRQKSIDSLESKIKYGFKYYEKELKRLRNLSDDELLQWLRSRYNQ